MRATHATRPVGRPGRGRRYAARGRRAFALALAGVALVAPAAHAEGEIDIDSKSSYVLQEKQEVVRATMTVTVRNDRASVRTGNYLQYYYLPAITIPIPADADGLTAASNGSTLAVTRSGTKDPSTAIATIRFPSNLLYGQTRTVTIEFVLKGEDPRSKDRTRVGPGHATFAVFGPGDTGQNTVEVVLPRSMTFDATTDLFSRKSTGGTVTYTATENNEKNGFWAVISARNAAVAKTKEVAIGDQVVDVQAYQDDKRWLRFVTSRMKTGVPVLEELIGTPWPGGLTTVREDHAVNVRGYDGWFDSQADEIVIGESLDRELLYHELTHAWATRNTLDQRWIYEGIAQELAARAVTELKGKPRRLPTVSPKRRSAIPLNSWGADVGGRALPADAYGYPASYQAMQTLLGDVADRALGKTLAAVIAGDSAYDAPGERDLSARSTDWKRFLDLVQIMGRNDKAPATFTKWVLTPQDSAKLLLRAGSLDVYRKLDRADGALAPPMGVRRAMNEWDFLVARQLITEVSDLAPAAKEVQAAAKRNEMAIPDAVAALYQGAETSADFAELKTTLPKAAAALEAVGSSDRAAAASRNPFAALGARVLDLDGSAAEADRLLARAELDAATTAAADTTAAARWITWLGLGIVLGGLLLVAGVAVLVRALLRRRTRRRPDRAEADTPALPDSESPSPRA